MKRYSVYLWSANIPRALIFNTDNLRGALQVAGSRYKLHKELVYIVVNDTKIQKDLRCYYPNGRGAE